MYNNKYFTEDCYINSIVTISDDMQLKMGMD